MKRVETAKVCALLKAAFPVWNTTPETIELYHYMLQDVQAEVAFRAVQDWILTEERFPTVAGIRRKCAEVSGVLALSAQEAWAEVSDAVERYGLHNWQNLERKPWSNEIIGKCVKAISWYNICHSDNPTATRAQFIKMYDEFKSKSDNDILTRVAFSAGNAMIALPSTGEVSSSLKGLAKGASE